LTASSRRSAVEGRDAVARASAVRWRVTTASQLTFAARSSVGPVRNHNEDAVAAFTPAGLYSGADEFAGVVSTADGVALVVLDGMGGQSSGGIACDRVREFLADQLTRRWPEQPDDRGAWLVELVRGAGAHLAARCKDTGQGTTIAMVVVRDDAAHLVHVGDSRIYLLRGDRLEQCTRDDSLINRVIDDPGAFALTPAQLLEVPRNVLVQVLGYGEVAPHLQVRRLEPGDVLLLSSDGLHEAVDAAALAATLAGERDPADVCAALVEAATRAVSEDNISALVARLERRP
jgi:serine/threonine protein phosphatase PrpC